MKRKLFRTFLKMIPSSYYDQIKKEIDDSLTQDLDYSNEKISMVRGIRHWQCAKEPDVVEWIEKNFHDGAVFYDIGANVGPFALLAAKIFKGKVTTYAFEPAYNNLPDLVDNIMLNRCNDCIFPIFMPLSNQAGLDKFHYRTFRAGRGLHTLGAPKEQNQSSGKSFDPVFTQVVYTITMDQLIYEHGLAAPDFIKLDVDGFEPQILEGAQKLLASRKVKSIIVEVADESVGAKMDQLLKPHGYKISSELKRKTVSNRIYELA